MAQKPRYLAKRADGTELLKGTQITTFRDEPWIYDETFHPRKIYVYMDEDPNTDEDSNGERFYPNRLFREFYPNVFNNDNIGIWDTELEEWSFPPEPQ